MGLNYRLLVLVFLLFANLSAQTSKAKIDSINAILVQNSALKTDSLFTIFQQNLENAQTLNYPKGIGEAFQKIATLYGYEGDLDARLEYNFKALRIFEQHELKMEEAYLNAEIGYQMKRDDMTKAEAYMNRGMKLAQQGVYEDVLDRIYNNYGVLKEMQGQLDSALYFYEKGLELVKKRDFKEGYPYSYSNLGGVYGQQGKYDLARSYFEKARHLREEIGDQKGIAENLTQIGEVYLAEGKNQEAISYFKKAVPVAHAQDYRFLEQYTYQQLSKAYKNLRQTDSALFYLERYEVFKDSINGLEVDKKIAELNLNYETEKKENQILEQRAQLAEKDLEVRRKNAFIYGSLALAFVLGLLGYLIYSRQKLKNSQLQKEHELQVALAKIETQNRLQEQRLRISRDLHDNIGSQLTFIISSIDNLKYQLKDADSGIIEKLSMISAFTSTTINELRDTIWAMNKEKISVEDLQTRISNFIERAQSSKDSVQFSFDFNTKQAPDFIFTSIEGVNIYRVIQEAVNNALKYAEAQNIQVTMQVWDADQFKVAVVDDGNGFDLKNHKQGNGLGNMKKRVQDIGATLQIETQPTQGTRVILQSK
ncbi:MAG: sensor histidine kinase [Bacteroidota bacterium]|nr:sensor histidine kinase [Bacteroidota bacterium]